MAKFNQTGPMGQGPMTGRRIGRCTNFGASAGKEESTTVNQGENRPENFQRGGRGFFRRVGRCRTGNGMGLQSRYRVI